MTSVMDQTISEFGVAARRLPYRMAKDEARRCHIRPERLDTIVPGLSDEPPSAAVEILKEEQGRLDRFLGSRGRIRPTHLRGALLYARWRRRFEPVELLQAAE